MPKHIAKIYSVDRKACNNITIININIFVQSVNRKRQHDKLYNVY